MLTYQRAAEILRRAGNSFSRHKNVWYYMHSASADSIPKVTAILQCACVAFGDYLRVR